ncbi:MAG: NAD-dependent epimerase/dehydratase family protein [Acidimicrobiales bacterium]
MTPRTVLVTGGASFLGLHVVRQLTAEGWGVRILDPVPAPSWAGEMGFDYRQGDVRDLAAVRTAVDGADVVVHAGFAPPSRSPGEIVEVNVAGTRNVLEAAGTAGATRLVLVSSTIVGRALSAHPLARGAPLSRLAVYRSSRVAAEAQVARAADAGLSVAIARPKTFLGPGGVGAFALLFGLVAQGRPVPVLGPGSNRYQLVDVRDLADGLTRLACSEVTGYFNFGATRFTTVAEDLSAVVVHAGTGARLRHVPGALAQVALRAVELGGLAPLSEWHQLSARGEDSVVDTSRARAELGWEPVRSNVDALVDGYDWFSARATTGETATPPRRVPGAHRVLARLTSAGPGDRRALRPRAGDRPA